jgi:NHL repeat
LLPVGHQSLKSLLQVALVFLPFKNYNSILSVLFSNCIFLFFYFIIEGISSIFAGKNDESGNRDGVGMNARFSYAHTIAIDQQTGTLFVSDNSNHNVRKITQHGNPFYFLPLLCRD